MKLRGTAHRMRGFTLLEALVTIVIVSIGLLGLLGLQTVSLADTQISAARSDASIAADNVADRMRANPAGAAASNYVYSSVYPNSPKSPSILCANGNTCAPAQMAAYDLWQWDTALGSDLPGGRGYISCNDSDGSRCLTYKITVAWKERDRPETSGADSDPGDLCPDNNSVTDRCFVTLVRP